MSAAGTGVGVTRAERNYSRQAPARSGSSGARRREWCLQGFLGALVVAYGVSTLVVHRPPGGDNRFWDEWVYTAGELLPALPMLACALRAKLFRTAWLAMSLGMVFNTAGDLVFTFHDQNLTPVPSPAPSDALYLLAYVGWITGVVLMTQVSFGRLHASVRLDGAIAGLAMGALAVMAWFEPLLHASGHPLQVTVKLAYPLADLVLIVLLVAGLAPARYRPNWPAVVLMTGVAWFVAGDVIYLNQSVNNSYKPGTPLDETWLIGYFLIGLASSVRDRRRAGRGAGGLTPVGLALVPVASGLASVAVIAAYLVERGPVVAPALALGALGLVIARMALTLQEARRSTHASYRDARTDYLTGLPNRRAFLEMVESALAGAPGAGLAAGVLVVDLDGFKDVNDALGHASGDILLRVVALRLEHRLGRRGRLARLGGDEYGCLCTQADEAQLVGTAQDLVDALSDPCVLDGVSVRVGASVGVALAGPMPATVGELLRCADVAMYDAKRAGSGVAVYQASSDNNGRERLALLDALRDAISARALTLHYQPTVHLRSGRVQGLEALVRWDHPDLGLLYPDRFIPLAERSGLMPQLTRAVLEMAVEHGARLAASGHRLKMSVNISRVDLMDEALPPFIEALLRRHRFPARQLTVEVTESALAGDPELAARCVGELRALGALVSVDDFGVGYSSMSELLGLDVDELKIDKSFVLSLATDPRAEAIVRSTVELGRALGLTVVAEGVESEASVLALRRLGADVGQGYAIARPLSPPQLEEFLGRPEAVRRLFEPAAPSLTG